MRSETPGFPPYWVDEEMEAAVAPFPHSRLPSVPLDPQCSHLVLLPPLQDCRKRKWKQREPCPLTHSPGLRAGKQGRHQHPGRGEVTQGLGRLLQGSELNPTPPVVPSPFLLIVVALRASGGKCHPAGLDFSAHKGSRECFVSSFG